MPVSIAVEHPWDLSFQDAKELQLNLAKKIVLENKFRQLKLKLNISENGRALMVMVPQ